MGALVLALQGLLCVVGAHDACPAVVSRERNDSSERAEVSAGSADEEETDDGPTRRQLTIGATTGVGYYSNIFEADGRRASTVSDGFSQSTLKLSIPFMIANGTFSATFAASARAYFSEAQADEYLIKPGIEWRAAINQNVTFTAAASVARFRELLTFESKRLFDRSEPGWAEAISWTLVARVSEKSSLNWVTSVEYQTFDSVPQNNFQSTTKAQFTTSMGAGQTFIVGSEWHYYNYPQRPRDSESSVNPVALQVVEGRGFVGYNSKLGSGWNLEAEVTCGPNLDITNGYYNAAVLGGMFELRYETGRWELKATLEPEATWFSRRPANLGQPQRHLLSQQVLLGIGGEFRLHKNFLLFFSETFDVLNANGHASKNDVTANNFRTNVATIGIRITF